MLTAMQNKEFWQEVLNRRILVLVFVFSGIVTIVSVGQTTAPRQIDGELRFTIQFGVRLLIWAVTFLITWIFGKELLFNPPMPRPLGAGDLLWLLPLGLAAFALFLQTNRVILRRDTITATSLWFAGDRRLEFLTKLENTSPALKLHFADSKPLRLPAMLAGDKFLVRKLEQQLRDNRNA